MMNKTLLLLLFLLVVVSSCNNEKQKQQDQELKELRELAQMDRREMENQYEQFSLQYDELKKGVTNDSLLVKLTQEQERTQRLLRELKQTKQSDAAHIRHLKQELETVRIVLRSYIEQVDSLMRENGRLVSERDEARSQLTNANHVISNLDEERVRLNEKVNIAAQLNASDITLIPLKKNAKPAKKTKDVVRFVTSFEINRNVTAATGQRVIYARLLNPNGGVVNTAGTFSYENKNVEFSASKSIEYTGEEQRVSLVIATSNDFLMPGSYIIHLFCDEQMIGTASFFLEK